MDIADYSKGNGYSKSDLTENGTPIILYGRLYTKYQFAIDEVDTFATPKDGSIYSQGNEVIIPASGETAEDIARASAVEKSGILLGGDLNILRPFNFINPLFLALTISNGEPQKELAKKAQGKSVVHIHNSDIQEVTVSFPTRAEQDRIVAVFRSLDNLITLHQRKCVFLFGLFQASISMIFTASTFSWEQRKLGDIASDMVAGGDIDKDLILAEGQYPVIANALTGDGIVGYYDKEYRVNAPAVTVTGRGDVGHAKARLVNFTPVVRLLSVKSEHDVFFLENAINTLKIVIESTGVPQLTVPQLAKYEVAFPRQLDEEEHIGVFFKQLDHLITLHQRECISFTVRAGGLILTANKKRTTSSWEQRKLGELALFNPKDELPQTFEYVDLESVVGTEMLSHRTEVKSSAPSRAQRLAHTGDLFYQTVRPYQKNNYLFEKPDNNYVFSTGYAQMRPYVDGYFLLSLVQSERFVKVVLDNYTGTSYPAINANDLAEIEVAAPSDESEAQKIGTIFRSIDNLITLHQRKGKAAVTGCSNDANNSKGVCCKARDFGYKCHKKDESQ